MLKTKRAGVAFLCVAMLAAAVGGCTLMQGARSSRAETQDVTLVASTADYTKVYKNTDAGAAYESYQSALHGGTAVWKANTPANVNGKAAVRLTLDVTGITELVTPKIQNPKMYLQLGVLNTAKSGVFDAGEDKFTNGNCLDVTGIRFDGQFDFLRDGKNTVTLPLNAENSVFNDNFLRGSYGVGAAAAEYLAGIDAVAMRTYWMEYNAGDFSVDISKVEFLAAEPARYGVAQVPTDPVRQTAAALYSGDTTGMTRYHGTTAVDVDQAQNAPAGMDKQTVLRYSPALMGTTAMFKMPAGKDISAFSRPAARMWVYVSNAAELTACDVQFGIGSSSRVMNETGIINANSIDFNTIRIEKTPGVAASGMVDGWNQIVLPLGNHAGRTHIRYGGFMNSSDEPGRYDPANLDMFGIRMHSGTISTPLEIYNVEFVDLENVSNAATGVVETQQSAEIAAESGRGAQVSATKVLVGQNSSVRVAVMPGYALTKVQIVRGTDTKEIPLSQMTQERTGVYTCEFEVEGDSTVRAVTAKAADAAATPVNLNWNLNEGALRTRWPGSSLLSDAPKGHEVAGQKSISMFHNPNGNPGEEIQYVNVVTADATKVERAGLSVWIFVDNASNINQFENRLSVQLWGGQAYEDGILKPQNGLNLDYTYDSILGGTVAGTGLVQWQLAKTDFVSGWNRVVLPFSAARIYNDVDFSALSELCVRMPYSNARNNVKVYHPAIVPTDAASVTVDEKLEKVNHSITVKDNAGGGFTVAGGVFADEDIRLQIKPQSGYEIKSITVNGSAYDLDNLTPAQGYYGFDALIAGTQSAQTVVLEFAPVANASADPIALFGAELTGLRWGGEAYATSILPNAAQANGNKSLRIYDGHLNGFRCNFSNLGEDNVDVSRTQLNTLELWLYVSDVNFMDKGTGLRIGITSGYRHITGDAGKDSAFDNILAGAENGALQWAYPGNAGFVSGWNKVTLPFSAATEIGTFDLTNIAMIYMMADGTKVGDEFKCSEYLIAEPAFVKSTAAAIGIDAATQERKVALTVAENEHMTYAMNVDPTFFSAGKTATVTFTAKEGYRVTGLTVNGTATAFTSGTSYTATFAQDTAFAATTEEIPFTGVTFKESSVTLGNRDPRKVEITIADLGVTYDKVEWQSSDTGVVTVANGVLTAVKNGTATITVTVTRGTEKKSATLPVTVAGLPDLRGVTFDGETKNLSVGGNARLEWTVDGDNVSGATVQFVSSDLDVATVDAEGNLVAVGAGTCTVTIKVTVGDVTVTDTVEITVTKPAGGCGGAIVGAGGGAAALLLMAGLLAAKKSKKCAVES